MVSKLFSPLDLRSVRLKNRIVVSPMCTYSAREGVPNDWHLVHLGSRASGGAALVFVEATGVSPEGRITVGCTGLWNNRQAEAFKPIVNFIHSQNAMAGIQLAHAGRKAGSMIPFLSEKNFLPKSERWIPVGPSEKAFSAQYPVPRALSESEINQIREKFCEAAVRADNAGFDVVELHMAHGYLLHQFLSPLSNHRKDQYGGSFENRIRFPVEVASEVRKIWPKEKPLFVRISATDYVSGGWSVEDSVIFSQELRKLGVDLVDVSSGGSDPDAKVEVKPLYQVPFSERIKNEAQVATGAVGLITKSQEAEWILQGDKADLIFLARELLRNPYWPIKALGDLEGAESQSPQVPNQYKRAYPNPTP
jgi:2,4-dienoyl-CoA reductase-like NADH-dependent reductase (Old Yellow Enzyme family)